MTDWYCPRGTPAPPPGIEHVHYRGHCILSIDPGYVRDAKAGIDEMEGRRDARYLDAMADHDVGSPS